MKYKEVHGSLFDVAKDAEVCMCHCISADFKLDGIVATKFKQMGVRDALFRRYPNYIWNGGTCLVTKDVIKNPIANLVTKEHYYDRSTLQTIEQALTDLRQKLVTLDVPVGDITTLVMPKLGHGLARLDWDDTKRIIQDVFKDTDLNIIVYSL